MPVHPSLWIQCPVVSVQKKLRRIRYQLNMLLVSHLEAAKLLPGLRKSHHQWEQPFRESLSFNPTYDLCWAVDESLKTRVRLEFYFPMSVRISLSNSLCQVHF
ncbi:hypothetical protein CRM22_005618 [Opisthorchis felineus]|uniref:Uncharacterized protein n=1 Tax=Opisthorchis felineus TaxID=147828 RepID=A0A4S2LQA5_OPIFE|nr:hypothetical protein CRM22_005618 [Opisthorchis felineus]